MPVIPFAATVGGWLTGAGGVSSLAAGAAGAATTAAIGGTAIVAGLGALGATGMNVASSTAAASAAKKGGLQLPQAPKVADAATLAQGKLRQRQESIARSKSIFTSPLGVSEQATTAKKSLLGQ